MQIGVESRRAVENKRVFIIDSDDISAMALQFMLADECEAHLLLSVQAALDKGRDWPPQLILLGGALLAAEGAAVVARFQAQCQGVRVMIVCDTAQDPLLPEARALGAAVLLRPLRLESVRRQVDLQLGRRTPLAIPVLVV